MYNQKEPKLEHYGLDSNIYQKYIDLKNSLSKSEFTLKPDYNNGLIDTMVIISGFVSFFGVISFLRDQNQGILVTLVISLLVLWFSVNFNKEKNNIIKDENLIIEKKRFNINSELISIKNKILPFEIDCCEFYRNYLESFHKEKLYKKRSGSGEFEESLLAFSSILEEVGKIERKFLFVNLKEPMEFDRFEYFKNLKRKFIDWKIFYKYWNDTGDFSYYPYLNKYESYISNRKINHDNQKNKIFTSFDEIKFNSENINKKENKFTKADKPKLDSKYNDRENKSEKIKKLMDIIEIIPPEKKYAQPRKIDWEEVNKTRQITGMKGEEIAMQMEKEYLRSINRNDLSDKVKHVSKEDGDGFGYDILSFFPNEQEKYIEVKSTVKSNTNYFNISKKELDFMRSNKNSTYVYRIFNVNENDEIPTLEIITAETVLKSDQIIPTQYIVKL